jgi:hypothetical protein
MYFSLNTIRVVKAKRMKWEGHVAQLEQEKFAFLGGYKRRILNISKT